MRIKGTISPPIAEFITKSIKKAETRNVELLVIELDTPGGLDESMRQIVQNILNATIPICVYVSPPGARAASAGAFILLSAHIAAMAPGTNVGAAHPVIMGKDTVSKPIQQKIVNDAVAYITSIAEKRDRNKQWAEDAVRKSISTPADEAKRLKVIDLVASSLDELLKELDGRKIKVLEKEKTLSLKNAKVINVKMNWGEKLLTIIANPTVAYILLLIGIYGIIFELQNPGALFPGLVGGISLILAFYALHMLPVNITGLLLILLSIVMFILEMSITSYGLLTIGGIISFVLGSIFLFSEGSPLFQIPPTVIIIATVLTILFFLLIIWVVIKSHAKKPVTGTKGLEGLTGIAKTDLSPKGTVFVRGELWEAESEENTMKEGTEVVVVSVEGLKLKVRRKK